VHRSMRTTGGLGKRSAYLEEWQEMASPLCCGGRQGVRRGGCAVDENQESPAMKASELLAEARSERRVFKESRNFLNIS
jgi:hypothetical protein